MPLNPVLLGSAGNAEGTSYDDLIVGDGRNNLINGNDGDDSLLGYGGDDRLTGGEGNYTIDGGIGDDYILGQGGDNYLIGGDGNDQLSGFNGNATIYGGAGDDFIGGGFGYYEAIFHSNYAEADFVMRGVITVGDYLDYEVTTSEGRDTISRIDTFVFDDGRYELADIARDHGGQALVDGLWSYVGSGRDNTYVGSIRGDRAYGNNGNDNLSGNARADTLNGGDGDDFLNGGYGFDRLIGGAGADRFYHTGGRHHGMDWIEDYSAADGDVLQFPGLAAAGHQASPDDFVVHFAITPGAGDDAVAEAFIVYQPTWTTVWAIQDAAAQDHLNLAIGQEVFDLLA